MARRFRGSGEAMCFVTLTYDAPLDAIDAAMPRHVVWLERAMADGIVVTAGRQQPRSGGVMIARGDRRAVEARIADDPFIAEGLARADVTQFRASFAAPAFDRAS